MISAIIFSKIKQECHRDGAWEVSISSPLEAGSNGERVAQEGYGPAGDQQAPFDRVDLDVPTNRGDIVAAALCLSVALVGYFVLVPVAVYVPSKFAGTINSPAFLPNVLFAMLGGLSALYLVHSLMVRGRTSRAERRRLSDWTLAAGTALICVGYVVAIYVVGMTVASALSVAVAIYYFGERRILIIAAISVVLPALLWLFFVKVAYVLMPTPIVPVLEFFISAAFGEGGVAVAGAMGSG